MIVREVFQCRFGSDGRPVAVLNRSASWSLRSVSDVVCDIESGRYRYVVRWRTGVAELSVAGSGPLGEMVDVAGPDGSSGGLGLLPAM